MSVLIWLATFFVIALIQTICSTNGIFLGLIPTVIIYGIGVAVARYLCSRLPKMWQCAHCQQLNSGEKSICACGHTKEWTFQQPGRNEPWLCKGCGRSHPANKAKCSCGYSKEWSLQQKSHV